MTTPMTTLESFNKCVWDISIDKVPLKDRPHVIDFIENITGLKTFCGRDTRERYRLIWVDADYIINGNGFESREQLQRYLKYLVDKGFKLTTIDFNIGGL